MNVLTFDPSLYIRQVVLVGCGGTGSHLARSIARMVYSMKAAGQSVPEVRFIDPDVVETANVGRQLFTQAEIGLPKAEALGRRFNFCLGLSVGWFNEAFDPGKHMDRYRGTILLGAVDNYLARRSLAQADRVLWIDCGNHRNAGQVVIGTSNNRDDLLSQLGRLHDNTIRNLPNAALLYPELLQPEPESDTAPHVSCTELMHQQEQGVLVNGFVASIAAEYLRKLLHREPITTHQTTFSGDVLAMRSTPITVEGLQSVVNSTMKVQSQLDDF